MSKNGQHYSGKFSKKAKVKSKNLECIILNTEYSILNTNFSWFLVLVSCFPASQYSILISQYYFNEIQRCTKKNDHGNRFSGSVLSGHG